MSYNMQKVPTTKCSHHFPHPDSINLWWIHLSSGECCTLEMEHFLQFISGIFASGLFALLVYAVKSVCTQCMLTGDSQVGTGKSDECTPLVETLT